MLHKSSFKSFGKPARIHKAKDLVWQIIKSHDIYYQVGVSFVHHSNNDEPEADIFSCKMLPNSLFKEGTWIWGREGHRGKLVTSQCFLTCEEQRDVTCEGVVNCHAHANKKTEQWKFLLKRM